MSIRIYTLIVSQSQHKVSSGRRTDIAPAVLLVRGDISHRPGAKSCGPPRNCNLHGALLNKDHFLVNMVVRRMRRLTRGKLGDVHFDGITGVRLTFEHGARAIRPVCLYRKVIEGPSVGRQDFGGRFGATGGQEGQNGEIPAGGGHRPEVYYAAAPNGRCNVSGLWITG